MAKSLSSLVPVLERSGFLQDFLTFGEGNQRGWDWLKSSKVLGGSSRLIWETLLLGQPADPKKLERAISSDVLERCTKLGLCKVREAGVDFGSTRLSTSYRHWFFYDRGNASRCYYGDDSRALMTLVPALRKGRALALRSETGVELPILDLGTGVDLTIQTSKRASRFVQANLELNGASPAIQVQVDGEIPEGEFDLIAGRIPGFVEPDGLRLPDSVAGGEDGMDRMRESLALAGKQLSKEGTFAFVGLLYGGDDSIRVAESFKELCTANGLTGGLTLTSKLIMELGVPVLNQTISQLETGSKLERRVIYERAIAHLKDKGLTHVYMAKGLVWRTRRGRPGFTHDLTPHYYGTWSA